MIKFELKQEHIDMISNLNFRVSVSTEYNDKYIPIIDRKRPFGNSGITESVLEILGCHCSEEIGEYRQTDIDRAETLLIELPVALEIVMQQHTFEPGTYEVSEYSAYFNYRHIRNYKALEKPIKEVSETACETEDSDEYMGRLHEVCMNVHSDNPWTVIDDLRWFKETEFLKKAIAIFEKHSPGAID